MTSNQSISLICELRGPGPAGGTRLASSLPLFPPSAGYLSARRWDGPLSQAGSCPGVTGGWWQLRGCLCFAVVTYNPSKKSFLWLWLSCHCVQCRPTKSQGRAVMEGCWPPHGSLHCFYQDNCINAKEIWLLLCQHWEYHINCITKWRGEAWQNATRFSLLTVPPRLLSEHHLISCAWLGSSDGGGTPALALW